MRLFQRVVDAIAAPTIGVALGAASFARRARVFHPDGAAFQATIELDGGRPAVGACALTGPGRHRAVIRLSKGIGLPGATPDILGFALRILDAHGSGSHQDLLLVTSAAPAVGRHLILPARDFGGGFYSSILPYRDGDDLLLFAIRPLWADGVDLDEMSSARFADVEEHLTAGRLRFELLAADLTGPWQPVGTIDVGRRLSEAEQEALRFNVFNTGESLRPAGVINAMRRSVYRASQTARPTPMEDPTDNGAAA
ncbi:MAG TPA: hypothetical protein VM345_19240 [Acidimicrobiales bacterium]|jgi:hypothetical protein|nr:hypothetical protein [Acidimicrobiales bacterium]